MSGVTPPPRVSVLMPVHDAVDSLERAARSVLDQRLDAALPGFELLALDDGSTDGSAVLLDRLAAEDPRLRVVHLPHRGLTRTLCEGVARSSAPWIARMDADDAAHPDRLRRQAAYLEANPGVALVATEWFSVEAGAPPRRLGPRWLGASGNDPASIARRLAEGQNCLCHPSVLFRRDAYLDAGGYDPAFEPAEDFELWLRLSRVGRLACLDEALMECRVRPGGVSASRRIEQLDAVERAVHAHWAAAGAPAEAARRRFAERAAVDRRVAHAAAGPGPAERLAGAFACLSAAGCRRVAVYGAGAHTAAAAAALRRPPLEVVAVLDDAVGGRLWGFPVHPPEAAEGLGLDAVVLSSDAHEEVLWAAAAPLRSAGVRVERLYGEVGTPAGTQAGAS